jgi:hypothetical protein
LNTARNASDAAYLAAQNVRVFSDATNPEVSSASGDEAARCRKSASIRPRRNGSMASAARASSASVRACRYHSAFGSAAGELIVSTMVVEVEENAMVAGARDGAGAEDVVCVRDKADLDLSRNSTIA